MAILSSDLFTQATSEAFADPKVDPAAKTSQEWTSINVGRRDVERRLEDCATSDSKHIQLTNPPSKGPHVALLHQAFEKLAGAALIPVPPSGVPASAADADARLFNDAVKALRANPVAPQERSGAIYGQGTAKTVLEYKKARNIRRTPAAQVDNIVGIGTITNLDRDLNIAAGKRPAPAPVDPRPVDQNKPLDIFVLFSGAPSVAVQGTRDTAAEKEFNDTFNTPAYLKTHNRAVPICTFGGRGAQDKSQEAVDKVVELRKRAKVGVTVILAVSVGGFPALRAAALLTPKVKLNYVAINDGSFFASEFDITFNPFAIRVPPGIVADKMDNFFQTFGHGILTNSQGQGGFMDGAEFHGPLDGFLNQDMMIRGTRTGAIAGAFNATPGSNLLPLAVKIPIATQAHIAAVADADPSMTTAVKSLIKP